MTRLLRSLIGVRCPLCRTRTRFLAEHAWLDHFGEEA